MVQMTIFKKLTTTMKKISLILTLIAGLFLSINVQAQTTNAPAPSTTDFYPGKWSVTVYGTPNGDVKLNFILERKDGKIGGAIQDTTGKELSKITQVDEKDKTITAYFNLMNYDLTLTLDPVDDDHVKGSLLGMFDAKGARIKDATK